MIWPSGLCSGRFIFSTRSTRIRLTATSSGASTSLERLPDTSRIFTRNAPIQVQRLFEFNFVSLVIGTPRHQLNAVIILKYTTQPSSSMFQIIEIQIPIELG